MLSANQPKFHEGNNPDFSDKSESIILADFAHGYGDWVVSGEFNNWIAIRRIEDAGQILGHPKSHQINILCL